MTGTPETSRIPKAQGSCFPSLRDVRAKGPPLFLRHLVHLQPQAWAATSAVRSFTHRLGGLKGTNTFRVSPSALVARLDVRLSVCTCHALLDTWQFVRTEEQGAQRLKATRSDSELLESQQLVTQTARRSIYHPLLHVFCVNLK